jgi:hypothetical protein
VCSPRIRRPLRVPTDAQCNSGGNWGLVKMTEIFLQRLAAAAPEARRTNQENGDRPAAAARTEPKRPEAAVMASRSGLLDLSAMPAGRPMIPSETDTVSGEDQAAAYYQEELDAESVRRLALLVKQQLSLQALSIANARSLGLLGLVRDISLM